MKVITAPEEYLKEGKETSVFLAGGITNCSEWQKSIIDYFNKQSNTDNLVLFNPRRDTFDVGNPTAAMRQIIWEYKYIEKADIFSMYFDNSTTSDQPICMYELGRNIVRMQQRFPNDWEDRIIITVEPGYKREKDVEIQVDLATNGKLKIRKGLTMHGPAISSAYARLNNSKY